MRRFLSTRLGIACVALGLLVVLDVGRSVHVRWAFSEPASVWNPDPAAYANSAWPPSAGVPRDSSLAKKAYLENCAICHGPDGRGNGASAPSMIPRPRDFTMGLFKYKSTREGSPPTDNDLYDIIANGLPASGMPYWRDLLGDAEIRALVGYVKSMAPGPFSKAAEIIRIPERPTADAASVQRGEALYQTSGCAECHGKDLKGGIEGKDQKNYPVVSRNLTAPWTFRGGASPDRIWLRLTTGLGPGPMPSYAGTLSDQKRWDIVNYLLAHAQQAPWQSGGALRGPGTEPDLLQRGRYLVHAMMCGLCHTEVNPGGIYRDDHYLAGGMRVGANPQGVFISRNLTSDPETGLGRWSERQIVDAIRDGRAPEGRLLNFWGMPWMYLHRLTDDDATAIARYLKSTPPVSSAVPHTLHFGFIETTFEKMRYWTFPIARPPVLTYAIGSYSNRPGLPPDRIEGWLIDAQWIVAVLGLIAWLGITLYERRYPRSVGGWLLTGAAGPLSAAVVIFGWFVYHMPTLRIMPPERVAAGATASIPSPDVSRLSAERAGLVKRGQYLFTVASCAYCHQNDGSGGFKVSGGNGSIFTPNISSDREAGIGAWSDDEIARAIRAGVSRNGRPLYWQGMPWDHFSNLDEEDVRGVVAYLRELPPIADKVPAYRPPAPDDCKVYTFWTHKTKEPGCKG